MTARLGHERDCEACQAGQHGRCTGVGRDEEVGRTVECDCRTGGHA